MAPSGWSPPRRSLLPRLLLFAPAFGSIAHAQDTSPPNPSQSLREVLNQLQRQLPVLQPPLNLTKPGDSGFIERYCIANPWQEERWSFCCFDPFLLQDFLLLFQEDSWKLWRTSCDNMLPDGHAEASWRAESFMPGGMPWAPLGVSTDGEWHLAVADLSGGDRALQRYLQLLQTFIDETLKSLRLLDFVQEIPRAAKLDVIGGVTDEERYRVYTRHFDLVARVCLGFLVVFLTALVSSRRHRFLRRQESNNADHDRRLLPHSFRETIKMVAFSAVRVLFGWAVRLCIRCGRCKSLAKNTPTPEGAPQHPPARTGQPGRWRLNHYSFVSPDMHTARVRWPFLAALYMSLQLMKMHNWYRVARDFLAGREVEMPILVPVTERWAKEMVQLIGLDQWYTGLTSYAILTALAVGISLYNYVVLLGNNSLHSRSWLLVSIVLVCLETYGLVIHPIARSDTIPKDDLAMKATWHGVLIFALFLLWLEQGKGVSGHLQEVRLAAKRYVRGRLQKEEQLTMCKICGEELYAHDMQAHMEEEHVVLHRPSQVEHMHQLVQTQETQRDRFAGRACGWLQAFVQDAWFNVRYRVIRLRKNQKWLRRKSKDFKKMVLQARSFMKRKSSFENFEEDPTVEEDRSKPKIPLYLSSLLLLSLLTPLLWAVPTVTMRMLDHEQRLYAATMFFKFHSAEVEECDVWLRTGVKRSDEQRQLLWQSCSLLLCAAIDAEGCPGDSLPNSSLPNASIPRGPPPHAWALSADAFVDNSSGRNSSNFSKVVNIASVMHNFLLKVGPDASRPVPDLAQAVHLCGSDERTGPACVRAFVGLISDLTQSDNATEEVQWVLNDRWASVQMPPDHWRLFSIAKAYYGAGSSWIPAKRFMAHLSGLAAAPGQSVQERAQGLAHIFEEQLEDKPLALQFWTQFDVDALRDLRDQTALTGMSQHYLPSVMALFLPDLGGMAYLQDSINRFIVDVLLDSGLPAQEQKEIRYVKDEALPYAWWGVLGANMLGLAAVTNSLLKIFESYRKKMREAMKGGKEQTLDPGDTQLRHELPSLFQATSFPGFVFGTCVLTFHMVYIATIIPIYLVLLGRSPTVSWLTAGPLPDFIFEILVMFLMKFIVWKSILFERFMMDKSGEVRNLKLCGTFFPVLIVLNFIVAQYQGVIRAILACLHTFTMVTRVDLPAMGVTSVFGLPFLKLRDSAYNSFLDVVVLAVTEYSPAKRVATSLIAGDSVYAAWYVKEDRGRLSVVSGSEILPTPRISKARIRWHLAVTLIRNPVLQLDRKWRLERERSNPGGMWRINLDSPSPGPIQRQRHSSFEFNEAMSRGTSGPMSRGMAPKVSRSSRSGYSSNRSGLTQVEMSSDLDGPARAKLHWNIVRRRFKAGALEYGDNMHRDESAARKPFRAFFR